MVIIVIVVCLSCCCFCCYCHFSLTLFVYYNNNNNLKDIKPENLLFDSKEQNAKIIVADFGLSRILSLQPQFTTKFGKQKQQQ